MRPEPENTMKTLFRPALSLFILLSLVTGLAYPLLVTGLAQLFFPAQAAGSLVLKDGKPVGSSLIGQPFSEAKYFWSRPSATSPQPYNAAASSGSNLGPTNPALTDAVKSRIEALRAADPGNSQPVPVDLVTASASGLDPHISVAAARYQAARVARERKLSLEQVNALVDRNSESILFGILGEPRVNVLALNLALDSGGR
jgi:K+-transporting ATPase ATPase C chain